MKPNPVYRHALLCLTGLFAAQASLAETVPGHCPSNLLPLPVVELTPQQDQQIRLQSDRGRAFQNEQFKFNGNVQVRYSQQFLTADQARYSQTQGELEAKGQVHYQRPELVVTGDSARLNLDQDRANIHRADYYLPIQGGRGQAEQLQVDRNSAQLVDASYTTCSVDNRVWQIKARSITLNQEKNEGVARHLSLNIAELPVFYLPYISFPLQGRKSGWLTPQLNYSQTNGVDIGLPYYFNLAPQRDLTLTPRYLRRRGNQLNGEFRYLNPASEGRLQAEYLINDRQLDRERTLYAFRHRGQALGRAQYGINLNRVSDRDYFRDLGSKLSDTSQSQLESRADLSLAGEQWRMTALIQEYQTLDNNQTRPYRRLPQLNLFNYGSRGNWGYELNSQYSLFYRDGQDQAQRLLLQPSARYDYRRAWGYARPQLRLRHTRYQITDNTPATGSTASSSTAVLSLDSGLMFERSGKDHDQTLEPRLNFSYSPYRRQQDLPNFDSAPLDVSYAQLFRDFRYNGGDRVGDQNRLTLGLSSGFIHRQDGRQFLRASLAHAYYLADQRVTLSGEPGRKRGDQLLAGELMTELSPSLRVTASAFQDIEQNRPDKLAFQVNYARDAHVLEFGYRYRRQSLQQIGAAGYLKLTGPWQLAGKWLYSLRDRRTPEAVLGLAYGSCCWRVQLLARQYIRDASGKSDRSIGLQIELSGLTGSGRQPGAQLAQEILGYKNEG